MLRIKCFAVRGFPEKGPRDRAVVAGEALSVGGLGVVLIFWDDAALNPGWKDGDQDFGACREEALVERFRGIIVVNFFLKFGNDGAVVELLIHLDDGKPCDFVAVEDCGFSW